MRIILHLFKWLLFSILGLLLIVFLLLVLDRDAQSVVLSETDRAAINAQRMYMPDADSGIYFSLLKKYGQHKTLAEGYELQCLLALSHYPELKEVSVDFLIEPAFLPLASRPEPLSVLFPWVRRKYNVIISNASADFFEPILLRNLPFNEQIGVIGHELAHTVYYQNKSSLQFLKIAYSYQFDDTFHSDFERETDKRAIAHGLGYQIYDFAFFVRRAFGQSEEQIAAEEGDTYLSPHEILAEMEKYNFYEEKP